MMWRLALLYISLAFAPAYAALDEKLADPHLEMRARALAQELRCLVCQNQSIDDSDAPLAQDLRALVRARLRAGDSDAAIRTFLQEKYGDFILFRPPFAPHTYALWGAPFLLLALGLFVLLRRHYKAGRR